MTSTSLHAARLSLWLLCATSLACSSDDATGRIDSGVDPGPTAATECSDEGSTRVCTCASGASGRKTCRKGKYSSCGSCLDARDDGGRVMVTPTAALCKAGYYVGEMEGEYKPGFASLGIAQSGFSVHFESEALNGKPPLSLVLNETANGPAGEFYTYTVNGGCMQGLAHSGNTDNPFVARLTGELDCNTGAFVGVMQGRYTLLSVPGLDFEFKGPITAQFVTAGEQLSDGEWTVEEPPALDGNPAGGGTGTWSAAFAADEAPDAGGVDPCQGIGSDDANDAGIDAGA